MRRRLFLGGLLAGTAAPAIVRASSLMPIWVPKQQLDTVSGLFLLMEADRARAELLKARMDAWMDAAYLATFPPVIVGADWSRTWVDTSNELHIEFLPQREIYRP